MWTPSLITIFGRAAETPPELIGAFALACGAAPLLLLLLVLPRSHRPRHASRCVLLVVARVALALTDGDRPQLVVASLGTVAGLWWLALACGTQARAVVPGLAWGLLLATTTSHAALGTYGAVWRRDVPGVIEMVLAVGPGGRRSAGAGSRGGRRPSPRSPGGLAGAAGPAALRRAVRQRWAGPRRRRARRGARLRRRDAAGRGRGRPDAGRSRDRWRAGGLLVRGSPRWAPSSRCRTTACPAPSRGCSRWCSCSAPRPPSSLLGASRLALGDGPRWSVRRGRWRGALGGAAVRVLRGLRPRLPRRRGARGPGRRGRPVLSVTGGR